MNTIDVLAQIGDLKEVDYRNTLAIASIIELLVDKGIIDRSEIAIKAKELDSMPIDKIKSMRTR